MAITKAIPALWSGAIKQALLHEQVFAQAGVVNRDYQGDISQYGDTVKVISISAVTIKEYTKNTAIADPDVLTDAETLLVIDQAKYFNFAIDDIDQAQTRPKLMTEAGRTAAWGLRDASDTYIATAMKADALAGNKVGAVSYAGATEADKFYNLLVQMDTLLTSNDVPRQGRFAIVSPAMYGLLRRDTRFGHATAAGDAVLRTNDAIGVAAGLTVYQSNNMVAGAAPTSLVAVVGHPMGYSFAEQILNVEPYRPQKFFSDALKGLYVYGGKMLYPEAIATAEVVIT